MRISEWCFAHRIELIIIAMAVLGLVAIIGVIVGIRKQKKRAFAPYFRKFHDKMTQGHPQYIFDENGNKYKIIGITHAPKTNGVINIRLDVNPEPGNDTPAYIRPVTSEIDKRIRSKRLNGWILSENDKIKVRKVIRHSKKAKK